jgi:hypothetical protein
MAIRHSLHKLLSIVITTSPIQSNPSTEMIENTLKSFNLCEGLEDCDKFIICDGYVIKNKNQLKRGGVTNDYAQKYEQFILNLENKINEFKYVTINKQPNRNGFAKNVKLSLDMINTPLVMIVQHDHQFVRPVNIMNVVNSMIKHSNINYVGFISNSVSSIDCELRQSFKKFWNDLENEIDTTKLNGETIIKYFKDKYELSLVPLTFWYDRIHIANVSYYKTIFNKKFKLVGQNNEVIHETKIKNYIEDTFGNFQRNDIKFNGYDAFKKYMSFIYVDTDNVDDIKNPSQYVIKHVNGRHYLKDKHSHNSYQM